MPFINKKCNAVRITLLFVYALRVGFEPTTNRLTAECSTTELPEIKFSVLFQVQKIYYHSE